MDGVMDVTGERVDRHNIVPSPPYTQMLCIRIGIADGILNTWDMELPASTWDMELPASTWGMELPASTWGMELPLTRKEV